MATADFGDEFRLGAHDVGERLAGLGMWVEHDEIDGMAVCSATPTWLSGLKPPMPAPWPARGSMIM